MQLAEITYNAEFRSPDKLPMGEFRVKRGTWWSGGNKVGIQKVRRALVPNEENTEPADVNGLPSPTKECVSDCSK